MSRAKKDRMYISRENRAKRLGYKSLEDLREVNSDHKILKNSSRQEKAEARGYKSWYEYQLSFPHSKQSARKRKEEKK